MDAITQKEFLDVHSKRESAPPPKKKKCGCKKGITAFDVVTAALAAYGFWRLGFSAYELISGLFQKEIKDPQ